MDVILDQETSRHNELLVGVDVDRMIVGACKVEVASESQTRYKMVASPKSTFHRIVCSRLP